MLWLYERGTIFLNKIHNDKNNHIIYNCNAVRIFFNKGIGEDNVRAKRFTSHCGINGFQNW